ncbi:MAG: hypothetical protein RL532_570, partial [Actinomycetota bacterium]
RIIPNERHVGAGLLKVVSTGMLVDDESTALMWRGLMLTKAVEQFLNDVHWGDLDFLLIDMPPGTGDVQISSPPQQRRRRKWRFVPLIWRVAAFYESRV